MHICVVNQGKLITMTSKEIIRTALNQSMSYNEYRDLTDKLLEQNKTTGDNHSEDMLHYTRLNVTRMNKWDKHYTPSDEAKGVLSNLNKEVWLMISEAWCGDAAHNVPVIKALSDLNPNIDFRIVLRDEHPELMDMYLTNGGRSIPKMIRLTADDLSEIDNWGPRPGEAQELVMRAKAAGTDYKEYSKDLQIWYARDRGRTLEKEMLKALKTGVTA